jgi:hypothetical protein
MDICHAHGFLCPALKFRNGLLTTGRITAGTAVQFILRGIFSGSGKNLLELGSGGSGSTGNPVLELSGEIQVRIEIRGSHRLMRKGFLIVKTQFKTAAFALKHRPLYAAAGTDTHLNKTMMKISPSHAFTHIPTVLNPVYIKGTVGIKITAPGFGCLRDSRQDTAGNRI